MIRTLGAPRSAVPVALCLLLSACASTRAQPNELRVLVYNIHAGKDAAGADNLERVANLVRDARADVVLLQEVDRRTERSGRVDQIAELARLTGLSAAFGKTLDYQGGDYGIAILSRWTIVRDTLVRLPVEPPQARAGGSYEPRGMLHVTILRDGAHDSATGAWRPDTLHVLNTHLDPSADDHYRRQEVSTIIAYAAALRTRGGRVLLGGDLNATPESAVLKTFTDAGLSDAWTACGAGEGLTYPASVPFKRIDYLLFTRYSRCEDARVIASPASDHRPLMILITAP